MKTILILLLLVSITLATPLSFTKAFAQTTIDGFSAERATAERRWEEQFRAIPDPKSAREHLRRLTAEPHIAGTKEDYNTAIYVRDQLRSYGLSADLKEYEVWLNYPNTTPVLELITTRRQQLSVKEAVVPGDPTSSNPKITPLFNGLALLVAVAFASRRTIPRLRPKAAADLPAPDAGATVDSAGVVPTSAPTLEQPARSEIGPTGGNT